MLCAFSFGCFQIYQNKSVKNIAIYFIGTIVPIKCMPKISAVGLFCLDKFEDNQTRTRTTFSECQTYLNLTLNGAASVLHNFWNFWNFANFFLFVNAKIVWFYADYLALEI